MLHIEEQVQSRINSLLKPLDEQTLRNRHEQFSVSLRREDRNARTAKRRLALQPPPSDNEMLPSCLAPIASCLKSKETPAPDQLELLFSLLTTASSAEERETHMRIVRRVAASDLTQRMDVLVRVKAADVVVDMYRKEENEGVKREAYWALCNLCASPLAAAVVHIGGIDIFWQNLWSQDAALLELSLWGLGNIAADNDEFRDQLLAHGLQTRVIEIMENCVAESEIERVCVWVLSNLVGGRSPVPMTICAGILPVFTASLDSGNTALAKDALRGLISICVEDEARIQAVLNTGHAPDVLALLLHRKASVAWWALKLVGRLMLGSVHQVQALLNLGVLNNLRELLKRGRPKVVMDVLWCLSNVCTQTPGQVTNFLSHPIASDCLAYLCDPSECVRLEASWIFANAAVVGRYPVGLKLVGLGISAPMTHALSDINPRVVFNMLEVCESLLLCGEREAELSGRLCNPLAELYQSRFPTVDALEVVASSKNEANSNKALAILHRFFSSEPSDYLSEHPF